VVEELDLYTLAERWLASERHAIEQANEPRAEVAARAAAAAFEEGVRAASQEDLLLAYESARSAQSARDVGSPEWLEARRVAELLRAEYAASRG